MSLFFAELRKVWGGRVFPALLAILAAANLLLLWMGTRPTAKQPPASAYRAVGAELSDKTMEEKGTYLHDKYTEIESLVKIGQYYREQAYGGYGLTQYRQDNAAMFDAYEQEYTDKTYTLFTDNLNTEYRLFSQLQSEYDTVAAYSDFLDSVQTKASQLSGISIFQNDRTGYDLKNIELTAQVYAGLTETPIDYYPQKGLYTAISYAFTDLILLASMQELRPLLNAEVAPYITKLSVHKIHKIINGFGEAAVLAVRAGFDMVQIHGDRMCGSFSSSVFNHRTDEYGGSAENRARFAVESVRAVRSRLPELPIDYKLAVRQEEPHYGNAGVVESELEIFVPMLVGAGVTSFHVTLANHSSLEDAIPPANHPYFKEQGCFLKFCDEVRQYTDKPITGVGGLTQPDFVEQQLASGRISCAAMSRQLLADPEWPNKVAAGQIKDIHRCVRCNKKCLGGLQQHQGTHCIYEKG